ncbi:MAG: UvrD-helicase domain-containing protein [Bacteroidota bacterium]
MSTTPTSPFLIYNASAGSGKTFRLTVDYLSLLFSSDDDFAFQKILAITFTNKAVGEMKERILTNLIAFSQDQLPEENAIMFDKVKAKTSLSPAKIQYKAKRILHRLINNYAGFEVSTIDAFTHRIIRTFAKDLGISINFEVEMDTLSILEEAVERLVDRAGISTEKDLTKVLIDFALEKINDDKSGNITADIIAVSKLLLNEKSDDKIRLLSQLPVQDFTAYKKNLKDEIKHISEQILEIKTIFFELIHSKSIEKEDFTRKTVPNFFDKIPQNLKHNKFKFDSKWQEDVSNAKLYNKSIDDVSKIAIDEIRSEIQELLDSLKKFYFTIRYLENSSKTITQISLLKLVKNEMDAIKEERNLLLISDFNQKISEQIRKQPAPFIYERLGERFQHYFIDEFQDTSQLQWKNLIPLIENALAGYFKDGKTGSITLVGDAKQSIYAWRGGDAQQFIDLYHKNSPFSVAPEIIQLEDNYRSLQQIVDFNNNFFAFVANQLAHQELQELFANAKQNQIKKEKGYVQIDFFDCQKAEEKNEIYPEEVKKIIQKRMLNSDESSPDFSDFCVLVRTKNEGIAVANCLNDANIPIISSETLLIDADDQVQFLLHLMQLSEENKDQESLYFVVDFLLKKQNLPADKLYQTTLDWLHNDAFFWQEIKRLGYDFSLQKFTSLPLYDALEYAIRSFHLVENANAYLQFFLDEVFSYSQKNTAVIAGFLDYWKDKAANKSIVAPEGQNAVQIMTIHKSKGLQFPIVIFPYASKTIDDTRLDMFWVENSPAHQVPFSLLSAQSTFYTELDGAPKSNYENLNKNAIMDSLNVLYVALTRPSKELYILSDYKMANGKLKTDQFSYASLLQDFLIDLGKWNETETSFSFGELAVFEHQSLENPTLNLQFYSTSKTPKIELVTEAGRLWDEYTQKAIERGNLVHQLLAEITYQNDVLSAIEKAQQTGLMLLDDKAVYHDLINKIVKHPLLATYFLTPWKAMNEQELFYQQKKLRPDRICYQDKNAVIIDYKTGEPNLLHQNQIITYAKAITDIGFEVSKSFLVYINNSITVAEV